MNTHEIMNHLSFLNEDGILRYMSEADKLWPTGQM